MLLLVVQILTLAALVWYASETRLLRVEDRKFHRRERRIDYHFYLERYDTPSPTDMIRYSRREIQPRQADAVATIANLGKLALVVEGLSVRLFREGGAREYRVLPIPVAAGALDQFIVADLIVRYLSEVGRIPSGIQPERQSWTGEIEVALLFYCRGRGRISEWQRYALGVGFNSIQSLQRVGAAEQEERRLTKSAIGYETDSD